MFGYWKRQYKTMDMYADDLQAEVTGLEIERDDLREKNKIQAANINAANATLQAVRGDKAELERMLRERDKDLNTVVQALADMEKENKGLRQRAIKNQEEALEFGRKYDDAVVAIGIHETTIEQQGVLLDQAKTNVSRLENLALSRGHTIKAQETHLNNIKAAANIVLDAIDGTRILNARATINNVGNCKWEHLDDDFPLEGDGTITGDPPF